MEEWWLIYTAVNSVIIGSRDGLLPVAGPSITLTNAPVVNWTEAKNTNLCQFNIYE